MFQKGLDNVPYSVTLRGLEKATNKADNMKNKMILIAFAALFSVGCNGVKRLTGQSDSNPAAPIVRAPSSIDVSWTDAQVSAALTFDQRNLLDKTAPFFDARYDVAWKPLYQAFLNGDGRNVFSQWFTDAQFRRVLVAEINLGKLDGLTI